jgi:CBS domain-containing protein
MGKQQVGSALVMDGDVVGIFTERDIVRARPRLRRRRARSFRLDDGPACTVEPDVSVREALDQMLAAAAAPASSRRLDRRHSLHPRPVAAAVDR